MEYARLEEDLSEDSLELVEALMSLEDEFGIEISEEDFGNWRDGGWLNGAPVPRVGPKPTLPDAAEAESPRREEAEGDDRTV